MIYNIHCVSHHILIEKNGPKILGEFFFNQGQRA